MKRISIVMFVTLLLLSTTLFAQKKCNCEENLKWVKETFEKNDAGFEYALQQKGKEAYQKNNAVILKKVKKATNKNECADILHEWLSFFRKAHFGIAAINNEAEAEPATGKNSSWPILSTSEDEIKKNITQEKMQPFEGIWKTANYTIGIIANSNGYKGAILSAAGSKWKTNQVKLEMSKDSSGVYYMGDYSSLKFDKASLIGKNTLKLGSVYLDRIYPRQQEDDAITLYVREMQTPVPFIQTLSKETVLFRIPSFDDSQKNLIDSLISANSKLLATNKNLIVDIRNNGGGSDISYDKIIPYLYTNPIRTTNVELLSTPLNNKRMEGYLSIPNLSERSKTQVNAALATLNKNIGKFVNLDDAVVSIEKLDSVLPNPQNVAIIIDENNGSTAEQFLLASKQSKKVKLFGKTTMGVLDISNMYFVESPDKQLKLGYCLSKSLRIPDMKIDNIGIQPDYYIDKSIPNEKWLDFVKNIVEQ